MSEGSPGRWFSIGSAGFLRSSALNVGTQAVVYSAAVICVPLIIDRLGANTFGLLTIFWIMVGAVPFLDLGLSQATVRFVSSALHRSERTETDALVRQIIRAATLMGVCLAVAAAVVTFSLTELALPWGPELRSQARNLGLWIAMAIPALLLSGPMRGVAQAARRFDLVNALQGGTGFAQWIGTLAIVLSGGGLTVLLAYTVAVRYLSAAASWAVLRGILPGFRLIDRALDVDVRKAVHSFGGWIFVSQAIGPLLLLMERLAITAIVSLEAQGWYSAPVDALLRFLVLPVGVSTALFPFLAATSDEPTQRDRMARMVTRSMRLVLILMIPVALVLLVYGDQLLSLWLGADLSGQLLGVWSFLVMGLLIHSLAQVPYVALQALDAPRDIAILLLVEIPVYLPLFILLTSAYGIAGAAVAWMLRVTAELAVLLWRTRAHLAPLLAIGPDRAFALLTGAAAAGLGGLWALRTFVPSVVGSFVGLMVFVLGYGAFIWLEVLDEDERAAVASTLGVNGGGPR